MSKNTKIIAIIGGVLILGLVLFSALTEGGCGETFNVWRGILGCKKSGAPAATRDTPKKEEAKPAETADDEGEEADEPEPAAAPADEDAEEGGEEADDDDDDDE